jgi:crotonobetaine/carnitine-CoA ligase
MQSHCAWLRGSQSFIENFQILEGDVLYNCLPMYNSAAWVTSVYPALVAGLPLGLDDHFSASAFWDRTRFYGVTHSFTLGAMHIFLWQAPERPDDKDNPVRVASAIPMPDRLIEPFKERFGIESIGQGYGQSEAFTILNRVDDGKRRWKPNSTGVPPPGFDICLLDDGDVEVPVGEVGEFCIRPQEPYTLFNGYFENGSTSSTARPTTCVSRAATSPPSRWKPRSTRTRPCPSRPLTVSLRSSSSRSVRSRSRWFSSPTRSSAPRNSRPS